MVYHWQFERLRQKSGAENVLIQPVDVTKTETIDAAVDSAIEEASDAEIERIYQTNFLGPIHLIQKVLPGMRRARAARL